MWFRHKGVDYMTVAEIIIIIIIIKGICQRPLRSIAATTSLHFCLPIDNFSAFSNPQSTSCLPVSPTLSRSSSRPFSARFPICYAPQYSFGSPRILSCCASLRSMILALPYDQLDSSFVLTPYSLSTFVLFENFLAVLILFYLKTFKTFLFFSEYIVESPLHCVYVRVTRRPCQEPLQH